MRACVWGLINKDWDCGCPVAALIVVCTMNIWKERGFMYNVQRRQRSPADRLVVLLYVVDLTCFRIPQNGGVAKGAVQSNTILFSLKEYSLWNSCKAAASVRWRCTTRQCWLNCRSTLQRNGHNFIGQHGDFIMTTHSLKSRITSYSFWLNLTLPPYSPNLAPCDLFIPITKDKAPEHSIWDLWSTWFRRHKTNNLWCGQQCHTTDAS